MEVSKNLDFTLFEIISRTMQKFNPNQARLSKFSGNSPCIFVLSTGRVGTATLSRLLGLSDNLIVHHEPKPKLYAMAPIAYKQSLQAEKSELVNEALESAFIALRERHLNHALSLGKGYVETSPQVTFLAPSIIRNIPEAKFIHLIRQPYDVVRSAMRRQWFQGNIYDPFRISPLKGTEAGKIWESSSPIKKNIWLWSETNRWISNFLTRLPTEQKLIVNSESLFNGEELQLEKLYKFAVAKQPSSRRLQEVLRKKINRQITGSFPSFKDLSNIEQEALMQEWQKYSKEMVDIDD